MYAIHTKSSVFTLGGLHEFVLSTGWMFNVTFNNDSVISLHLDWLIGKSSGIATNLPRHNNRLYNKRLYEYKLYNWPERH